MRLCLHHLRPDNGAAMTEAKPTPGVWMVIEGADGGWSIVARTAGDVASVCDRAPWPHRADESRANCHLIAAAPETAAARERLRDVLMSIAGLLEIPRSENNPCDDVSQYERAIESMDVAYRQAEADRVKHASARYKAEAERDRLRALVEELVSALTGMLNFPTYRGKPIGAPGSIMRAEQNAKIEAEDRARVAIAKAKESA